jgi:endonuclease/exonuclease/phosphatase family metal-dependent hydrolase
MGQFVRISVRTLAFLSLFIFTLMAPGRAEAQTTVVLDAPGTESIDTMVQGGKSASKNFKKGHLATRASDDPSYVRRALMKFDTETRIPARATITSARLTLTVRNKGKANRRLDAYSVVTPFDDAVTTWAKRKTGYNWKTPGGDLGKRYAQGTVTGVTGSKVTFDVTRLVQEIVNGRGSRWTRIAVLDPGADARDSYREYFSSEDATASRRPTLTVVYGGAAAPAPSQPAQPAQPAPARPAPPAAQPPSRSARTLRVLTWNSRHGGRRTDGVSDPAGFAKWVIKFDPDVAALNEIDTAAQAATIVKHVRAGTPGVSWSYVYSRGNMVMTRLTRVDDSSCLLTPSLDRRAAHMSILVNNRPVNIWNSHLDVNSGKTRLAETRALQACGRNWSEARIAVGDFNMQAGSAEHKSMLEGHVDAWPAAKALGRTSNYSANCDGCTRNSRIDYVFTSKKASVLTLRSAQIFDTRNKKGVMPSDHKPLLVVYDVK